MDGSELNYFPFAFSGVIERHNLGTYAYIVLWLPAEVAEQLPLAEHPRLRISGELNEYPFAGAWQPSRGRWYLMLGKPLLRATGLAIGSVAELRFRVDPQELVDLPDILVQALERSLPATDQWNSLKPGKQRALSHFILGAKRGVTRTRRTAQTILWLEERETDLRRLPRMIP